MANKTLRWLVAVGVVSLLAWGIVRAGTSRFEEQSKAILNQIRAERERLHLSAEELRARYPTPMVGLCRFARIAPGGAGEVVFGGNFQAGTKFLFDNDKIQVVREAFTVGAGLRQSEYRASIKVAQSPEPDTARVVSFQPVTGAGAGCEVVYIGGKYEWEFTADNGWRIKLASMSQPTTGYAEEALTSLYRAEFYRGGETKPFEVRVVVVGGTPAAGYFGNISQSEADSPSIEAEIGRLSQKMIDPKLSERERGQLMKRQQELTAKMMQQMEKMSDPKYVEELEKKKQEFGCHMMSFSLSGSTVEGIMRCGEKVGNPENLGRLELKGTMKYLGP